MNHRQNLTINMIYMLNTSLLCLVQHAFWPINDRASTIGGISFRYEDVNSLTSNFHALSQMQLSPVCIVITGGVFNSIINKNWQNVPLPIC